MPIIDYYLLKNHLPIKIIWLCFVGKKCINMIIRLKKGQWSFLCCMRYFWQASGQCRSRYRLWEKALKHISHFHCHWWWFLVLWCALKLDLESVIKFDKLKVMAQTKKIHTYRQRSFYKLDIRRAFLRCAASNDPSKPRGDQKIFGNRDKGA